MQCLCLNEAAGVKNALYDVAFAVASARACGISLLKLVHGEGKLREPCRRLARSYRAEGRIVCLVYGEHIGSDDTSVQYLLDKAPAFLNEKRDSGVAYLYVGSEHPQ